jgi:hypothetical protein
VKVAWSISLYVFLGLEPYDLPYVIMDIFVLPLWSIFWYEMSNEVQFEYVCDVFVDAYYYFILVYMF